MGKVTRKEWYRRVNASWPETVPPLTGEEAVRAAKRLYRFVSKQTYTGEITVSSGNRYSGMHWTTKYGQINGRTLVVNPERGWKHLVHELSHSWERYAGTHGHNSAHARFEMRMIKEVVRRGWLDGKLKTEPKPEPVTPTKQDVQLERWRRTAAAITRWEAKLKRAENALKKLRRRERYYQRALSDKQAA